MKESHTTDILILGAGIGGYETFRTLSKRLKRSGLEKHITIVDQNNYFTFVPMLHEVATGSIEPTHCAIPLRELTYNTPHTFLKASVEHIDPKKKQVQTDKGILSFNDYCVIALGSTTHYFNTPGAKEYSYNVRTLEAAMRLKHDFLSMLDIYKDETLTITIVGGGYTGVEVAGQYADLANKDIAKLYPEKKIHIRIIQSGDVILPYMPKNVQERVHTRLTEQGVEIVTKEKVTGVTKGSVRLQSRGSQKSDITIWTAGFENVAPHFLHTGYNTQGRIDVTGELTMIDHPDTYAAGDIANIVNPSTRIAYPQLAEAAHLEGEYIAHHIVKRIQGKTRQKHFVFQSKGQLMPVGDWWGVAQIGPFTLFGKLAWWIRRTVYVLFMPGILRKLRIVFDWTIHSFGFRDFIHVEQQNNQHIPTDTT